MTDLIAEAMESAMESLMQLQKLVFKYGSHPAQSTAVPRLALRRSDHATEPEPTYYRPMIYVVLSGAKRLMVGSTGFEFRAPSYLLTSVGLPVEGQVLEASPNDPYLAIELLLDVQEAASFLIDLPETAEDSADRGFSVSPLSSTLSDAFRRLAALVETPQDAPTLAPLIEREILYRVYNGPQGSMLRKVVASGSRLGKIRKVIEWLRTNYTQSISVQQMAQIAGMSVTSFHRTFKTATSLSPLSYQKRLRLQEARRLLGESSGVGDVAFRVGYESPSQFSREYSRMFGVSPRRDMAKARYMEGTRTDPSVSTPDAVQ